jgi:nuclear pore complex protein Nup155
MNVAAVKSIAIDNERKMLYILYIDSSIELVYLGDPVYPYKSICRQTNIIDDAIYKFRQQSKFFNTQELEISSIHVISEAESKKIHLLAITIAGYRLYFSHYKDAFRPISQAAPINKLELGYIRAPPQDMNRDPNRPPRFFTNTYYSNGICLSIHPQSDVIDQLEMTAATSAKPATENQPVTTSMSFMMVKVRILSFCTMLTF